MLGHHSAQYMHIDLVFLNDKKLIFFSLQIEFSPYHDSLENTWVTVLYNSFAFSFHQNQFILDHFVLNACTAPLCILLCFKLTYFF